MVWRSLSVLPTFASTFLVAQLAEVSRYDVGQGLPQSMVNHILQDRDGFMWFGTGDGLARFDGQRFVVYKHDPRDTTSLSHNSIWGLAEADARHLWIGTRAGLDLFDRGTGAFQHMHIGRSAGTEGCWQPVSVTPRRSLFYSPLSCELMTITGGHVERRPTGHWGSYCWLLTADGLDLLIEPDTLVRTDEHGRERAMQIIPYPSDGKKTSMIAVGDDRMLLSERSAWILSSDGQRLALPSATREHLERLPGNKYAKRAEDGRIWIAIDGTGVVVLRSDLLIDRSYRLLPPGEGPLITRSIYHDRQGNTWIGSDGKGVFKISPQRIKFERCVPGMDRDWEPASWFVRGFAQWDDHRVLIAFHKGGLALFDERDGALAPFVLPGSSGEASHRILNDVHGLVWSKDDQQVMAIDPSTGKVLFQRSLEGGVALTMTPDQRVLLITRDSLWRTAFTEGKITTTAFRKPPMVDSVNTSAERIFLDPIGQWWFSGVLRPITVGTEDHALPFTGDGPAGGTRMMGLWAIDDDHAWMTTNEGLLHWSLHDRRILDHFTIHDGLPDQFTYCMLPANDAWWISTNNGLSLFDPTARTFRTFSIEHGLQSREFNSSAALRSRSGRFYFGGVNGFNHFDPARVLDDSDTPNVVITSLRSRDTALPPTVGTIELPYHRNELEIGLAVLEFTAPERNRFAYQLEGYDTAWRVQPPDRPIRFENLPDGSYHLLVRGINGDGVTGATRGLLAITVPLPFWASAWAKVLGSLLLAVAAASVVFLAYRQRVRRRLERTELEMKELRLRTRLAQDLHDDVGSGLAQIAAIADLADARASRGDASPQQVGRVGTISRELIENLRDVVWMNDPGTGDLAGLLLRVRDTTNDLFEGSGTKVSFRFPDPLPERAIGGAFKRNVFLIAKEAALNARRYANAHGVEVSFDLGPQRCRLEVADDGRGVPVPSMGCGRGLANLRSRAEEIGCTMAFVQHPGEGSIVSLECPITALNR